MQTVTTPDPLKRPILGPRGRLSAAARGVAAGLAGTTVMTVSLKIEQIARRRSDGPVDYDASDHVVTAAATVLRHNPRTPAGRIALFQLVHWGYGSAVAAAYPVLRHRLRSRPRAAAVFYLACQTMAMTLFPTLGGTPPPWRWRRTVLLSSFAQHALYAATVCATDNALTPKRSTHVLNSTVLNGTVLSRAAMRDDTA
ncbi:MAG: hypothetical protein DLM58_17985 [Pseudonocardiales bacterium]|nr:MAG: hypothetical protein DLM58_17985 [Pseudonocardiales bacterium]